MEGKDDESSGVEAAGSEPPRPTKPGRSGGPVRATGTVEQRMVAAEADPAWRDGEEG